jgi:protein-disulfide isomerase
LTGYDRSLATKLLASQRPYDCCDDTIAGCLEQKPTCSLAFRLSENICRRVAEKQARATIVVALRHRSRSMSPRAMKAKIDLTGLSAAGDASAPVTLVEYACPRCPYCAWMTPEVYEAVTKGPLKGKVKLYLKTFPIRGHHDARKSGLAFVAAEKLGHFWEFVLYFYQRSDQFSVGKLPEWAEAAGMDRGAFERTMAGSATLEALVETKKEGIVGGVGATPTFFINGRKYHGDLTREELVDVLEEEFNRISGIRYRE